MPIAAQPGRGLLRLGVLAWATLLPAQEPGSREPSAQGGLMEIAAETLIVGPGGSHREGRDRATLAQGRVGVLRTEVHLPPGAEPPLETVEVELRVRVDRRGEALHLAVDSTARPRPEGEMVLRSGGGALPEHGPLFYEAFVSPRTGQRVVFLLTARPWVEAAAPLLAGPVAAARPVAFRLRIFRLTPAGDELLESATLGSLVGHTATYGFGFRIHPPGEEARRESLTLEVRTVELRDGLLSGILRLKGHLVSGPVSASVPWSLAEGGEAALALDPGEAGGEELGFRVVLSATFP